jgi:hypothetical protein
MTSIRLRPIAWLVGIGLALAPRPGFTDLAFDVTMKTSSLVGSPDGPFALDIQLNDGSGPVGNNSATISALSFGPGGSLGSIVPGNIGTYNGDLSTTLSLADGAPSTDFAQYFTPGDTLRFHVALTTNADTLTPISPDEFSIGILYGSSLLDLPTLGPLDQFLSVAIDGVNPSIEVYTSDPSRSPMLDIPDPTVSPTAVPEPNSLVLLATGFVAALAARLARRARRDTRAMGFE